MTDGTFDSGIEFDIASLLSVSDAFEVEEEPVASEPQQTAEALKYHELKSRVVVVESPRTDFRNTTMGSRTQLRMNLDRQQVLDQEEREKQIQHQRQQQQQQSDSIAMPSSYHSAEVPPKVIQTVKTSLQHPTMYHIKQKQQQAVKIYLDDTDQRMPAHSMPNLALPTNTDTQWISGSAPTDMEASGAFEDIGLLDEIILDQSIDFQSDSDLQMIEPSLLGQMSHTLPQQPTMYQSYDGTDMTSAGAKSSSSCPPVFGQTGNSPPTNMTDEQAKMWAKDRQKKDNHNMIERRRRFNINDRIKELGTLLPKNYTDQLYRDRSQNKGTILKASVDYIKKLKRDSDRLQQVAAEKSQKDKEFQKLQLKFTQLLALAKQNGNISGMVEEFGADVMVNPSSIINMQQFTGMTNPQGASPNAVAVKVEDQYSPASSVFSMLGHQALASTSSCDFMEDNSPVSGDPMLTSAPVSPDCDDDSTF